ncbi:hypothetical protein Ddye_028476 [Dipteronia dyeriana]|uniref:Uncharacterized protein n=1 Tax=Dipteronia dyeriana TaxID=168575 RepID=A0AAD9WRF4_9ROSI|nr:hypothetical protein Ddye_028476 [Dipteronia dyeriana]
MAEHTLKVDGVIRVSPNSDSNGSITESTLPLTLFDIFWLKFHPVERLFFYELTDLTHHFFDSVILPNLKRSLSLTLLHYLPLTGKIKWPPQAPKPAVFYSPNDGVSVTVAESSANFDRVSADDIHEALELRPLTPELVTSDEFADMVALQITLFPNKGFSIGVSTHHAIFDGKSSTTFIKSWAHLCKSLMDEDQQSPSLPPELTPSFDRTVIKDPTGADVSFVEKWFGLEGKHSSNSRSLKVFQSFGTIESFGRGTFELTREDLKKLRNRVEEYYQVKESKNKLHLSTFVLTCAYVFVCMVKARGGDRDREVVIGFTADYRTRLEPPIPSNYFGNCLATLVLFLKAGDLMEEKGFEIAADKLSEAIKGLENKRAVEALEEIFDLYGKVKEGTQILSTSGSNRFGVYETDFGWGRPKKVEIVSIDRNNSVSLAESRRRHGGVEVGLVLDKNEMDAFASFFNDGLIFV